MFGLKFILLLILTGGIIAYVGDLLGRRVGRRRLTILGLRPKWTAIIITIISGILITLVTLAALSVVSENARDALFRMEKIKKQVIALGKDLRVLKGRYGHQQKNLQQKRKELREKVRDLRVLSKRTKVERKEFYRLQEELEKVLAQRNQIQEELSKQEQRIVKSREEAEKLKATKRELNLRLKELKQKEVGLEEKIKKLRVIGDEVFARLRKAQLEKEKAEAGLEETKAGLLIFKSGEEVIRAEIQGGGEGSAIRSSLIEILKKANKIALSRGAKTKKAQEGIVVYQKQLEEVVQTLKIGPADMLLRLFSTQNVIAGEPLYLRFDFVENKIIFKQGEVLIERIIKQGISQDRLEQELLLLLQESRQLALQKGVLTDPQGEMGEISAFKFYDLVDLIKGSDVNLKVQVVTIRDIYTRGPLEIDLKVIKIE